MKRGFLNNNLRVVTKKKEDLQKASVVKRPGIDFMQILPHDLVNLVTKHLDFDHLIRFSSVSRSWSEHSLLPPMNAPWLIVPFDRCTSSKVDSTCDDAIIGLFSPFNGSVYKLEREQLRNRRICGSCLGGWIITVNEDGEIRALCLLSKTVVKLPSIRKLPDVIGFMQLRKSVTYIIHESVDHSFTLMSSSVMCEIYVYKAVMSSADPTTSVVMVIQGLYRSLAFCRPGKDKTWSHVEGIGNHGLEDITFYRGKFYAVRRCGHVFVVEGLDGPSPSLKLIVTSNDLPSDSHRYYLVEVSDDLLLVTRTRCDDPMDGSDILEKDCVSSMSYKTTNFKVSKLDFDGPKWIEDYNLGKDRALFVGFNQSFSLTTTEFPGCKGNSIYFTDDFTEGNVGEKFGGHDIGIFDLANGSIEKCYSSNAMGIKPPPIWFTTCSC
ncbi:hypothetical protein ACHQM5_026978 [Ranunculus cassubicifolius]